MSRISLSATLASGIVLLSTVLAMPAEPRRPLQSTPVRPKITGVAGIAVKTNVSMVVPDGTEWLEYMVDTGTPSPRTLGIWNHLAFGTLDQQPVAAEVKARGYAAAATPKIGRDGRWLMDLYDADLTRVEFMVRKPVQTPCCSTLVDPADRTGAAGGDGSGAEQVTTDGTANWSLQITPDGKFLVFLTTANGADRRERFDVTLRRMNLADRSIEDLTAFLGGRGSVGATAVTPTGQHMVFVSYQLVAR